MSDEMKRLKEENRLLKKSEKTLRSQQEYLMAILNSIADPICIKDSKHNWVLVNDMFCAVAGQDREELIGKSDYEFFRKKRPMYSGRWMKRCCKPGVKT